MEEHSFLYGPVNRALAALLGKPPVSTMSPRLSAFFFPNGAWLEDHVIMALVLFLGLAIVLPLARRRFRKRDPNAFQNVNEALIFGVRSLIDDVVGHKGAADHFMPLLGSFTYFILIANLMGFFFFLTPPTASFQTTLALAITSFVYFNAQGIREHGVLKYLAHFAGPIPLLAILIFPIEIISNTVRILSLSLRLVGNIGGEHVATGAFFAMAPIFAPWPMMIMGLVGAALQTFVFLILSTLYIAFAVAHEEH